MTSCLTFHFEVLFDHGTHIDNKRFPILWHTFYLLFYFLQMFKKKAKTKMVQWWTE